MIGSHSNTHAGTVATIDFLGDLSGPGGNVFAIFGAIKDLGRQLEDRELLTRFKAALDADREAGEIEGSYDDVLDLVEVWFGKQSAINEYRDS